jgi:glycosyltransferase involved in cell wall biosynthesis
MKILLISNELGYRGTPRFLTYCASIAKDAGHAVLVWGIDIGGTAADDCRRKNIDVIIGESELRAILQFKPDIVHIHRGGGPSRRDSECLRALKNACSCRVLETNVFGIADFTPNLPVDLHSHISCWDLWRWRRWLWPFHQAGIALPYCLDTDAFKPITSDFRQKHGIPPDAFLIGRLGKTDWNTLAVTLARCMAARSNIRFASVDDYSAGALSSLPKELRTRVVTVPRINGPEALSAFYSACDVTVNFSPIGESFGYGIAESMSCGTPVIVLSKPRNDNAQIELAAPEYGGFPVNGPLSAAATILELESDRVRLSAAAAKCRSSIEQRYSKTVFTPKLLKAYDLLHLTTSRGRTLEKVFSDHGFITDFSEKEIMRQLSNVRGGSPCWFDTLKMLLAYSYPNALRNHLRSQFL